MRVVRLKISHLTIVHLAVMRLVRAVVRAHDREVYDGENDERSNLAIENGV